MNSGFRVVRFLAYAGDVVQFDEFVMVANSGQHQKLTKVGDAEVAACDAGWTIDLAVKPFRDPDVARAAYGNEWRKQAVAALKQNYRIESPHGILQRYHDPIDGKLRNLAE